MTSQGTPQTSPSDPRLERKKDLELRLKMKHQDLARMQDRIFASHLEILNLECRKGNQEHNKNSHDRREVTEHCSESDSEWSSSSEDEFGGNAMEMEMVVEDHSQFEVVEEQSPQSKEKPHVGVGLEEKAVDNKKRRSFWRKEGSRWSRQIYHC